MLTGHSLADAGDGAAIARLRALVDDQHYEHLLQQVKGLLLQAPDDDALQVLQALAYAQLGNHSEAERLIAGPAARVASLTEDVQTDLAAVWLLLGHIEVACERLESVLEQEPQQDLALARLAFGRVQQGRMEDAIAYYRQSLLLKPERFSLCQALASLYLQQQQWPEAQQMLDQAIAGLQAACERLPDSALHGTTARLRGLQLELWLASGEPQRAEAWLQQAGQDLSESEWLVLVSGYARLLAGQERHDDAEAQLRLGLKVYPEALTLVSQLAELLCVRGRIAQAGWLLQKALRVAADKQLPRAGLWVQLGQTLLMTAPEKAHEAATKALELVAVEEPTEWLTEVDGAVESLHHTALHWRIPLMGRARHLQAMADLQRQHYDEAEHALRQLLLDFPDYTAAMQGLAQLAMQLGRVDDAIDWYERIQRFDPAAGFAGLVNAHRFPEDENTLHRLEKLAQRPGLSGSVSTSLLFQLATAWEKRGNYDKALALVRQANEASKLHIPYDPVAHRQQCARIRYAFSRSFFQHRQLYGGQPYGHPSSAPVFVVGMPRSGTTLVEQMLASHSEIWGAGELGVIPQRIRGLNNWERHIGSGRRYPDCVDDLTPYVCHGIAEGILQELFDLAQADKPDARFVIDKLPHNFEHIGLIKFLFPNARIISVRRDPRDIALSNYFIDFQAKHGGMGFAYDLRWIGEQLADHNLLMQHWHGLFGDGILELQYEQLLQDPEGQARRMLEYIGVAWEPQVLAYSDLERPVKTASVWQVRQPIYQTSKAKWKHYANQLGPLTEGTNAKIIWDEISMLSLPEPGFLSAAVALYHADDLDGAERSCKKMLYHNPQHAACQYLVGLIYCRKGHLQDGIGLMRQALQRVPWQRAWQHNLVLALMLSGQKEEAAAIREQLGRRSLSPFGPLDEPQDWVDGDLPEQAW
ncbi:tetratricopeptide repeat-containing sulfotransferase family protein [Oceanobacter sp. 3_MG-2023]|uniref:tetratricopeptide repeat-containing sulfotransferase family protein n=1 Tax=Oceanobacter sp. 3_MG-2023 TaxID=3062622 RepID=UPI0027368F2F|nr:tetratricopeptide repeat-containing sulfotransferase family protein [Oceanobacter sp. 3_MG-2023]MDP2504451.1 sulfotransferase [Oceanobacter sp. 3_MG-2023]